MLKGTQGSREKGLLEMGIYTPQPEVVLTEGVDETVQGERVQRKLKGTMSLKSWEENSQSHR